MVKSTWLLLVSGFFIISSCSHEQFSEQHRPYYNDHLIVGIDTNLVRLSDSMITWLSGIRLQNGLIETSYGSNLVSLYDNALLALVYLQANEHDRAAEIFSYFHARLSTEMLAGGGGYFQFRNAFGQPQGNRWLGDNAWLLIALNYYEHRTGDMQFHAMQEALHEWIRMQQDTDGGLWGGTDASGAVIGKVTEGMIDAFNAVPGYLPFHDSLLNYLEAERWDFGDQLPISWPGSNYYYALDNFSWGYCAFEGFPDRVLDEADRFKTTQWHAAASDSITGYCFDEDRDVVWFEGTSQIAVALIKAGRIEEANTMLHELAKAVVRQPAAIVGVGLPYASNMGTGYGGGLLWSGADTQPCTAATAWFIMAARQFDPMALNYVKGIPDNSKFW